MRNVKHPAAWHREQSGLLDGFIGEWRGRDADGRDATLLQMDEVAHTARRTGASIGECFDHQVSAGGDLVDQGLCGRLGEDFLGRTERDRTCLL